jgi:hypothetical protein
VLSHTIYYEILSFTPDTLSAQAEYDINYMSNMQSTFDAIKFEDYPTYEISTIKSSTDDKTKARKETKLKKVTGDSGMTEKRFWQKFIVDYLKQHSSDEDAITNIINAYKFYKPAIEDSVLDDNNNIVNYSLASEMPIIRLNITYKYRK